MKILLFFSILLVAGQLAGQSPEWLDYYKTAMKAYNDKDFSKFYENISAAGKIHPYHQSLLYLKARAAALTGRNEEAITCLRKALQINASFPLEEVPDFSSIKDSKEFGALMLEQKELKKAIVSSDTAFVIKDRALHSEGISYDPEQQLFYIGSIHKRKIITVNKSGYTVNYCPSAANGMTSIFGVKVDVQREILWACSSPMEEMENYDSMARSAVFKFDLLSGKLLKKFEASEPAIFGDLTLTKDGTVYVSDSKNNEILKVNETTEKLELFYASPEFWNIQGLAFSQNEKTLFISDYIKGVFKLTLATKILTLIPAPEGWSMKGVDGLYFYKNSLIAIQNGVTPNRATRYFLGGGGSSVTKCAIIDRGHPAFNEPTLGVISGSTFYYIANSQWGGYDDQHHIKPDDQLQDIVVLKYRLDRP